MTAKFTEDTERAQIQTECLGGSGKESVSHLYLGSKVSTEDSGLAFVSSQAPRNWSKQGPVTKCPL